MIVNDQIKDYFEITCIRCGSDAVTVSFSAGYVHPCGGDIGYLSFECDRCSALVEIDDD